MPTLRAKQKKYQEMSKNKIRINKKQKTKNKEKHTFLIENGLYSYGNAAQRVVFITQIVKS